MPGNSSVESQGELKDKTLITVFGASGDLAKKMTFPSLFALYRDGYLPKDSRIIGYARSDLKKEDFEDKVAGGLGKDEDKSKIDEFKKLCQYVRGPYDEDEGFQNLEKELTKLAKELHDGEAHRVFYLAVPPSQFTSLSEMLAKNNKKGITNRLVIEKPFGKDTKSSKEMMEAIGKDWKQEEIYRIDHFLGEEMVKTILPLRFGNPLVIDAMLNKDHVQSVLIEWTETFGCEGRGGYFDEFGIIRDMLQNHFMQILTYLTMDKPESPHGDHIRDKKVEILKAIKPIKLEDAIVGQYTGADGKSGYLEDESVEDKESRTETFVEALLKIDNERWQGVPFILKSGKALEKDVGRVVVQFKRPKDALYDAQDSELVIQLMPEHRVTFNLTGKRPGIEGGLAKAPLELDYEKTYKNDRVPDAYEVVIYNVLKGDTTSFVREDELIAAWKIFTPLLEQIADKGSPRPHGYKYGSKGPEAGLKLEEKHGFIRS